MKYFLKFYQLLQTRFILFRLYISRFIILNEIEKKNNKMYYKQIK